MITVKREEVPLPAGLLPRLESFLSRLWRRLLRRAGGTSTISTVRTRCRRP